MRPNISKSLYAIGHCRIVLRILIERIQNMQNILWQIYAQSGVLPKLQRHPRLQLHQLQRLDLASKTHAFRIVFRSGLPKWS